MLEAPLSSVSPCSICASRYPMCVRVQPARAPGRQDPRRAGLCRMVRSLVAVPCGVDVRLGHAADVRPAAKETAEMPFLIAPCRDFDGAVCVRIRIELRGRLRAHTRRQRAHRASREILAFEMRSGNNFGRIFVLVPSTLPMRRYQRRALLQEAAAQATPASAYAAPRKSACERRSCRCRCAERMEIRKHPRAIDVRAIVRHEPQTFMPRHGSLRQAVLSA